MWRSAAARCGEVIEEIRGISNAMRANEQSAAAIAAYLLIFLDLTFFLILWVNSVLRELKTKKR